MGFLHKLWDETLAGPMPETGLGKLRKYDSFTATRSSPAPHVVDAKMITRSITILKSNSDFRNQSVEPGSTPGSPSGSSTPGTPLSPGTPRGDFRRCTRRKSSAEALESAESRSPTVYDWIVISALDR
ncbi:dormancy-associated protein homolog 4-like [Durio zibethinus]|uniref:Dormancy-associated protein homolog 4-like n=1 Tax=Durio zibethinus TaxID=66656 RepID=A0A6P5X8Z2_DURZI|nr:dormancy-associated protein homolog 4-like [Durio zibethinus]